MLEHGGMSMKRRRKRRKKGRREKREGGEKKREGGEKREKKKNHEDASPESNPGPFKWYVKSLTAELSP